MELQLFVLLKRVDLFVCCVPFAGHHTQVSQCPPNEFECRGTDVCIHLSKLCDGVPDCTDGRDEGPHCRGNTHADKSQSDHEPETDLFKINFIKMLLFFFEVRDGIDVFFTSQFPLNQCHVMISVSVY